MDGKFAPKTVLGKWSVGLNALFLITVITAIILDGPGMLWATAFSSSIIGLVTGIIAVKKKGERSILVYLSIFIGICTVLFIIFHSLFISD